ncbi:MAG: Nif3-like dinuclear metal center hexameric protein [Candidatus Hodarchaeota archaeon]
MLLKEIVTLLEKELSPKVYNFKEDIYGLHYGQQSKNKIIKKIMITPDLSLESIHYALKKKVNLIISLNGLISKPITQFNSDLINKLTLLSRYPINIFVLNHSFIAAEGGILDTIMNALYLKFDKPFFAKSNDNRLIPIGRLCFPNIYPNCGKSFNMVELLMRIKSNLEIENIFYVGDLNRSIEKICIIGGELLIDEYLQELHELGCDCLITGEIDDNIAKYAKEKGICLIKLPLFKIKVLALRKFYNILSLRYPNDTFFFFKAENPLKSYN